MKKQDIFLGSALLATLAATWMVWPFADAILWAVFTAYFAHYFANHLNRHIKNWTVTTSIMILLLIGFVASIMLMVITSTNVEQVHYITSKFSGILMNSVEQFADAFGLPQTITQDMKATITEFTALSSDRVVGVVRQIPTLLIKLLIYFVVSAFLIKDGKWVRQRLFEVIGNLPEEYQDVTVSVVRSVDQLFRGVFLTYLIVALVVGTLATAGFYAMGVDFYWGWGLIITVFAFFPIVSAPMVYVPLSLLYISLDEYWLGVLILMYGVVVLNTLPEVLLRPYLAAHQTKEHPLLLFIGFIIGPLVMGLKGIILGPIILVVTKNLLTMTYFSEYQGPVTAAETEAPPT